MSDEIFIKKYEELLDKGYCDCNEMNCIDNNTPRRILNVVKNLQQENQELKKQNDNLKQKLNWIAFGDDPELALRYLRKIGYVDFDEKRKVYINKHNHEPFWLKDEQEKAYYIQDEELNEYTEQLEWENQELKKQLQELEKENLILREIVMIKKMAIPYEEIKDKSLYDLYDMPSYIDLVEEDRKYKEVIDKLNKYMYSDYLINSKEIKDILKKVK